MSVTDDPQVSTFVEADLVDIRRFCGYPAYAGNVGLNYEADFSTLEIRLGSLATAEQAVISTSFLPILRSLETDVTAASAQLGIDSAGPFKRNAYEIADRMGLYYLKRRELCAFIGVRPGRSISGGSTVIRT